MVVSAGDATSDLVHAYGLGEVVGFEDVQAVEKAIHRLLDVPAGAHRSAFERARKDHTWERAAGSLVAFCQDPHRAADRHVQPEHRDEEIRRNEPSAPEQPELKRLRNLVKGYESGRFIRLTRWLHHLGRKE